MNIVSAVILCTIVGAIGAVVLVLAAKFMAVEEDPRIEEVSACLAGANCGGCGYAGCADYAKAVVMDGVPCDKCAPGGPKAAAAIAKIMGGEASAVEKKAVVQCQGNSEHCKPSYEYKGIQTCAAAATLYGGPKTCTFACIGLGDCTKVCKFDAIHIVDGVAKVDKDKCTGCGACANICPKHVIMIDAGGPRKPVVMCSNQDKGAVANKLCTTSCIACGMCERTCKFDAIHVVDGVARVDYDKCKGCGMCAQKCPKHIILFPLKDDPNPPKPVVKQAPKPAAARHHDLHPVIEEIVLILPPGIRIQFGVVGCRPDSPALQQAGGLVYLPGGAAIDDARIVPLPEHKVEQNFGLLAGQGPAGGKIEVGPVEAGGHLVGGVEFQMGADILPHMGCGGGRKGSHHRALGQAVHKRLDAQVAGAEVLPPLADAVGLVHRDHADLPLLRKPLEARHLQPLRCYIDDLIPALPGAVQHQRLLVVG